MFKKKKLPVLKYTDLCLYSFSVVIRMEKNENVNYIKFSVMATSIEDAKRIVESDLKNDKLFKSRKCELMQISLDSVYVEKRVDELKQKVLENGKKSAN